MSQPPDLEWRDDVVPVSTRFDDPYYSLDDGLAETRHVFLDGNDLPSRFAPGFHMAELGFGTGLTVLAAWKAWRNLGVAGRLRFTSFEAFPMPPDDMQRALAAFPELGAEATVICEALAQNPTRFETETLAFEMIVGDARQTLPAWRGCADAWCLDGFSPAKNPELWGPELMQAVADHMMPGATLATYTAAGHVRRALAQAGLTVTRGSGFGRKRHMTTARKPQS